MEIKLCINGFQTQLNFNEMKKIFFAVLMLAAMGGIMHAQTTPAKTIASQKKEAVKKETKSTSPVNSVTPVNTSKNTATKTKTNTKAETKPATTTASSRVAGNDIGKHKKHHAPKKRSSNKTK